MSVEEKQGSETIIPRQTELYDVIIEDVKINNKLPLRRPHVPSKDFSNEAAVGTDKKPTEVSVTGAPQDVKGNVELCDIAVEQNKSGGERITGLPAKGGAPSAIPTAGAMITGAPQNVKGAEEKQGSETIIPRQTELYDVIIENTGENIRPAGDLRASKDFSNEGTGNGAGRLDKASVTGAPQNVKGADIPAGAASITVRDMLSGVADYEGNLYEGQPGGGAYRGSITIPPVMGEGQPFMISVSPEMDASTLMHEAAHFYLANLRELARQYDVEDLAAISSWWGENAADIAKWAAENGELSAEARRGATEEAVAEWLEDASSAEPELARAIHEAVPGKEGKRLQAGRVISSAEKAVKNEFERASKEMLTGYVYDSKYNRFNQPLRDVNMSGYAQHFSVKYQVYKDGKPLLDNDGKTVWGWMKVDTVTKEKIDVSKVLSTKEKQTKLFFKGAFRVFDYQKKDGEEWVNNAVSMEICKMSAYLDREKRLDSREVRVSAGAGLGAAAEQPKRRKKSMGLDL